MWHRGRFYGFVPAHLRDKPASRTKATRVVSDPPKEVPIKAEPVEEEERNPVVAVAHRETTPESEETDEERNEEPIEPQPEMLAGDELAGDDLAAFTIESTAGCCETPWIWGRGEYLLWWTAGNPAPALATTSPNGTGQSSAGVLGQLGTTVPFGGGNLHSSARSGGRYTLGAWFDPGKCHGLEVSYLHLADDSDVFNGSSADFNILARPFFDTVTGAERADLIVYPSVFDGTLNIDSATEFQSFEFYYRTVGFRSWCGNVDYYFGYRHLGLDERLRIDSTTTETSGGTTTVTSLFDQFDTETTFHGGVMGAIVQLPAGPCWTCEAVTKLALGNAAHRANISGQQTRNSSVFQGGLLAQGTNVGTYTWDKFSAASEFGVTLRRQLQCGWEFRVGYNLIYWAHVARSGAQIDRVVNTSQIAPGTLTGTARPAFPRQANSFWAQGVTFGLEYSY